MAIVQVDPPDWQTANVVQLDSDAPDNDLAMREIDDWGADKGFARTTEYWLRRIFKKDGRRVFRGICYRLSVEEVQSADEISRQVEDAVGRMPRTTISSDGPR